MEIPVRFVESTLRPQNRQTVFASGHSFVEVIKNDFGKNVKKASFFSN